MAYRTLYPLQLGKSDDNMVNVLSRGKMPSLVHLCAKCVIADSAMTAAVINSHIPRELFTTLMAAAFDDGRDRAVNILFKNWPSLRFCLDDVLPPSSALGQYDKWLFQCIKDKEQYNGVKSCFAALLHCFKDCLLKRLPSKLCCVDLRGMPTDVQLVDHIVRFCKQGYRIRDMHIFLDLRLLRISSAEHLVEALKVCQSGNVSITVHISKLFAACIGRDRVTAVLSAIQPNCITGLSLPYNTIGSKGVVILSPVIQKFSQLTALDFSCNAINLLQHPSACKALGKTLSYLVLLERLDLSNNRLSGQLPFILSSLKTGLRYLKISACLLVDNDIKYLKSSHHITTLEELDISENTLSKAFPHLLCLIVSLADSLIFLELQDINLDGEQMLHLARTCLKMNKLQFLDLSKNECCWDLLLESCLFLSNIPTLHGLQLSYAKDCYFIDEGTLVEKGDDEKVKFKKLVCDIFNNRPPVELSFTDLYTFL